MKYKSADNDAGSRFECGGARKSIKIEDAVDCCYAMLMPYRDANWDRKSSRVEA